LTGFDNLDDSLGDETLDWLRSWGVSLYVDDRIGGNPFYQQPSWHFRSLLPLLLPGSYPLRTDGLDPGEQLSVELRGGASAFYRFGSIPGVAGRLMVNSGGATPPKELQVTIIRIR
jgi:hypothetical protein